VAIFCGPSLFSSLA